MATLFTQTLTCSDCRQEFEFRRAAGQRGRPPKYDRMCRVLRALYPGRCARCRKVRFKDCKHKESK